ncbi:TPA: hypothetical protein LER01_001261 [Staphylococcus pseudintermedius]|nr:hypothetical protein [Staphylococcus pseudintermedius]EHT8056039.1 hypothetical protein [Staphylococcus pseudintermedius]EHT8099277.1 hypothetical protein [Staphylococcus pseudintermedius]EJA1920940.1 hypothetical protein [Staphylococcus pseudintermedius]EJG0090452.1 hypothetical protein [Staphylococcus pseudintermedius]
MTEKNIKITTVTTFGKFIEKYFSIEQFEMYFGEYNIEYCDKLLNWEQTAYGMRPTKAIIKMGGFGYQTFSFEFPPATMPETI